MSEQDYPWSKFKVKELGYPHFWLYYAWLHHLLFRFGK